MVLKKVTVFLDNFGEYETQSKTEREQKRDVFTAAYKLLNI